jgi:GPH family glycoside/pentoside/hexuronide:cation symporter
VQPPINQISKPLDDIKDLLNNKPWLILFALAMIIMMTIVFRGSSATYYFKYFVERPDLMGAYIGVQMAAYAVGCLFAPQLTKLMDKAKLLMVLMGIVGTLSIAFSFVPKPSENGVLTITSNEPMVLQASDFVELAHQPGDSYQWLEHQSGVFWFNTNLVPVGNDQPDLTIEEAKGKVYSLIKTSQQAGQEIVIDSAQWPIEIYIMFLFNILISLALGPKSPIAWSMYADAADYNEWKTGRRATAMTFSAATFSQKLGGALGSAGVLWVLASVGYSANQVQAGASITSIVWLQTLVPAFFAFAAIYALRFYELSTDKLNQIQQDLIVRSAK